MIRETLERWMKLKEIEAKAKEERLLVTNDGEFKITIKLNKKLKVKGEKQ